ncbi:MAG: YcgL domain-containing protein [Oceanospirillaceae bacterium]|nr:YcgL domain-containing protein [Oceanospirillaceae bacterium]
MKILSIYKSSRKDEMYLYVEKAYKLTKVPAPLMEVFGTAVHVMDMPLKADRELARVDTAKLLKELALNGFYLQMPPPKEDYMLDLHQDRPTTGVR